MNPRFSFPAALAVFAAVLQSSCEVLAPLPPDGPGGPAQPGYPEDSGNWKASLRTVWRAGFEDGQRDNRDGFRFNDDRGALRLDGREREIFRRGYRSGYYSDQRRGRQEPLPPPLPPARDEQREEPGNAAPEWRRQAYRDGFRQGEADSRTGRDEDWRRHDSQDRRLEEDFRSGYTDGYSRRRARY